MHANYLKAATVYIKELWDYKNEKGILDSDKVDERIHLMDFIERSMVIIIRY